MLQIDLIAVSSCIDRRQGIDFAVWEAEHDCQACSVPCGTGAGEIMTLPAFPGGYHEETVEPLRSQPDPGFRRNS